MASLYSFLIAFLAGESIWILSPWQPLNDRATVQKLHDVLNTTFSWVPGFKDYWVIAFLLIIGVMSLLIGIFFASKIMLLHRERKRITHESSRGHIQISLQAIRTFIERLLVNEFGLRKYRVMLHQTRLGLEMRIRATIPVGRNVLQTSERMQKIIQERVEDRLGVKVKKIEIIASGVVGEGEAEEDEEGTRVYTSGGELD
jgi:uncharacterized alkaline shock family protein YloU